MINMIEQYNDPIIMEYNKDSNGNYITKHITNETHVILNGKVLLVQIPSKFNRVKISGYTEVDINTSVTTSTFKVDYGTGIVYFHDSLEGTNITVTEYYGRGVLMYPASRVYDVGTMEGGEIVNTLQKFISDGREALEAVGSIDDAIATAESRELSLEEDIATATSRETSLEQDITTATNRELSLEEDITTATSTNTTLSTTIDNASSTNTTLNATIDNAHTINDTIAGYTDETTNTYIKGTIDNANDVDTTLNTTINNANSQNTTLNTTISNADSMDTTLNTSIDNANSIDITLNTSIDDANSINYTLSNTTDGTIKQANTINSTLNTTITSANNTDSTLKTTIKDADAKNTTLNATISDSVEKDTTLNDTIVTATSTNTTLNTTIDNANSINDTIAGYTDGTGTYVKGTIDNANDVDATLNTTISTANSTNTTLNSTIDTATSTNTTLNTTISNAETINDTLSNDTTGTIRQASDVDSTLNTTISNASSMNTTLNTTIDNASSMDTTLNTSITDANTINDTLSNSTDGTIKQATDINYTLSNTTDGTIKKATNTNTTLNTTISNAETENTTLNTTISNAQTENTTLNTTIDNADSTNTTLNTSITDANTINDTLSTPTTGTIAQAESINTTLSGTGGTIETANSTNTTLNDTISTATSKNTTLNTTISNADSMNTTLSGTVDTASSTNTTLTNTNNTATSTNTTLNSAISDAEGINEKLEKGTFSITNETAIGTINGTNKTFKAENTPIKMGTLSIESDGVAITDNGDGTLTDGGTIDYVTGSYTLFNAPATSVYNSYTYITSGLIKQASDTSNTLDGSVINGQNKVQEIDAKILEADTKISETETARQNVIDTDNKLQVFEAYDNLKTYYPLNKVYYSGSSYVCIVETTGNDPTNTTYWQIIARAGEGAVSSVSSANSDISVTDPNINPVLTLNSGTGANQIPKLNASGKLPDSIINKGIANTIASLDANGLVPESQIPNVFREILTVETIAERDALTDLYSGLRCHVKDASADSTVTSGWAEYRYNGTSWDKVAELESIDVVTDWTNVQNKPTTLMHTNVAQTITDNLTIRRTNSRLIIDEVDYNQGNAGLEFTTNSDQGVTLLHEIVDEKIPESGQALILNGGTTIAHFVIDGNFYSGTNKVYHEGNLTPLTLGETSTTAYRGDLGKVAYDYSQVGHLPLSGGTVGGNVTINGEISATTLVQSNVFRQNLDSTSYSHFVRNHSSGYTTYFNQVGTGGIAGFSQGNSTAGVSFVATIENDGSYDSRGEVNADKGFKTQEWEIRKNTTLGSLDFCYVSA